MQTVVKKWFRDKDTGFLDNGAGSDILVRKDDLIGCTFLRIGATVNFECHLGKHGLIAKKVSLFKQKNVNNKKKDKKNFYFGVMT